MSNKGSFMPVVVVMIASFFIAFLWDSIESIKNTAHWILDPTLGTLLNWNLTYGMLIIILLISLFMTLVQKYATDQETLKELKREQKLLQEEMKKYQAHEEEYKKLFRESMSKAPEMMMLGMRPIAYTGIPLILLFRWFMDFFSATGDVKFFGFLSWFWFYLIGLILFGVIFRKIFDVV